MSEYIGVTLANKICGVVFFRLTIKEKLCLKGQVNRDDRVLLLV